MEHIFQAAPKYGLIGGLIAIAGSLISMLFLSDNFMMMGLFGMFILVAAVALPAYMAIKYLRDGLQGGSLTFMEALATGVCTALITGIIASAFAFIYHNYIDPGYLEEMGAQLASYLEEAGAPEETIEQSLEGIRKGGSPSSIFTGALTYGGVGLLLSIIFGLVLKRDADPLT